VLDLQTDALISAGIQAKYIFDAYKNVDDVIVAVEEAGLANRVARLRPHLVVKG